MPAYLIWDTDMICICMPSPDGLDPQEDTRRTAAGYYVVHVGLRPDEGSR